MKLFFEIDGAVLAVVVAYIWIRRPRKGMTLRLAQKQAASSPALAPQAGDGLEGSKSLNVIFTYNAHDWDAYEVLGLPAGSSLDKVDEAYEQIIKGVEPQSREFLQAAYRAIQKSRKATQ